MQLYDSNDGFFFSVYTLASAAGGVSRAISCTRCFVEVVGVPTLGAMDFIETWALV
jgi:hypothetical protein